MNDVSTAATDEQRRARWIARGGWLILILSAGSALLPALDPEHGAVLIGILLIATGLTEIFAGTLRLQTRKLMTAAGTITTLAGLLFMTQPATHFLSAVAIIAGSLFLRSIVLGVATALEHGAVRTWTGLSAAMDFVLALILAAGISIATLVVTLFGATPPLVASFAWVLALSFVVNGLMLLRVASAARQGEVA